MKQKIMLVIMTTLCIGLQAQNIQKKYHSRSNEEGTIYFINPLSGFESQILKSKLTYDISTVTTRDSVTFNFSFQSVEAMPLDSVAFSNNNQHLTVPASILFIEPSKKNKWENRISLLIEKQSFIELFEQVEPLDIVIYKNGLGYDFNINKKKWDEQKGIITKIFDIQKYNK